MLEMAKKRGLGYPRIGLSRAIGTNDGGKVGVAEEESVVALVGLEVWGELGRRTHMRMKFHVLNNSRRMSLPMVRSTRFRRGGVPGRVRRLAGLQWARWSCEGHLLKGGAPGGRWPVAGRRGGRWGIIEVVEITISLPGARVWWMGRGRARWEGARDAFIK
jgi:hypothetical protein